MTAPVASVICTFMICCTIIAAVKIVRVRVKTSTEVEVGDEE